MEEHRPGYQSLENIIIQNRDQGKLDIAAAECNDPLKKIVIKANVPGDEISISEKVKKKSTLETHTKCQTVADNY